MSAAPQSQGGGQPRPTLTVFDAVAMIVGIVIGVGIFKAPAIVAGNVATETAFMTLWIAGGLISLVGALCYAELGSSHPNAGGEYYFLSRAYGDWLGFLFAWARMMVIQTGAIAAIAFVFGDYASTLLSLGASSSAIYAALGVVAITALNVAGTSQSKWVQNVLTTALALAVLAVVVSGLTAAPAAAPVAAAAPAEGPGPHQGPVRRLHADRSHRGQLAPPPRVRGRPAGQRRPDPFGRAGRLPGKAVAVHQRADGLDIVGAKVAGVQRRSSTTFPKVRSAPTRS